MPKELEMSGQLLSAQDVFIERRLKSALKSFGDYVYGYYRPSEQYPFYVGKGKGDRVLDHWKAAHKGKSSHRQHLEIAKILQAGAVPVIRILAHNLQETRPNEVYSVVERVLQNTFGIERTKANAIGRDRIPQKLTLVQYRDDGKHHPAMSLEAAYCKGGHDAFDELEAGRLAAECNAPLLLVGVSRSYQAGLSQDELAQMARRYWNLGRFENTSLPALKKSRSAVLAAWTSSFGHPQIVGVWRIKRIGVANGKSGRHACNVKSDNELRRRLLGCRLPGSGNKYFGPRIYLP